MSGSPASHHELLEQWHAGTLTGAERADMLRRLREDAALRAEARSAAHLHLLLEAWFDHDQRPLRESVDLLLDGRTASGQQHLRSAVEGRLRTRATIALRRRWFIAAAAGVAGVLLAWWALGLTNVPAVRDDQGRTLASGAALGGDRATTVLWRDGSSAQLAAGTQARLADAGPDKRVVLERGQLAAEVAPQHGGSFAITAPHGDITVLGTGFRVMSVADATTVVVAHGQVRVRAAGSEDVLARGQAARLSARGLTRLPLLDEAALALVAAHPPQLAWNDRRPIGMFVHGLQKSFPPSNPNGWFNDDTLDVRTVAGQQELRRRLLALVDQAIVQLRAIDAQGVVWWNPEGNRWLSRFGFVGDAARLSQLAPEIDALADEVMQRFAAAGLRTGVVIRPWVLEGDAETLTLRADPARARSLLDQRIAYAERRWGCTLFPVMQAYTAGAAVQVPLDDLSAVAAAHPRALLIADHVLPEQPAQRAVAAVSRSSRDLRAGALADPDALPYPGSPLLIHVQHQPQEAERNGLLGQALREGAIVLFPVGSEPDPAWPPLLNRLKRDEP